MSIYGAMDVEYAWLVDPLAETLEVHRSERGRWTLLATHRGRGDVRVEPFEAVPLPLSWLFTR